MWVRQVDNGALTYTRTLVELPRFNLTIPHKAAYTQRNSPVDTFTPRSVVPGNFLRSCDVLRVPDILDVS